MPGEIPNEILLQIIGWLVGIGISLLVGCGSLAVYVFSKFREDNDCEHSEIKSEMCDYRREIRQDIKDVHSRIDGIKG